MAEETKVVDYGGFKTFGEYQTSMNEKVSGHEKTIGELETLKGTHGREIGDLKAKITTLETPVPDPGAGADADPFTEFMSNPAKFIAAHMAKLMQTPEGRTMIYKVLTAEEDPEKNPFMEQRSSSNWLHAVNEHPELKGKEFQDEVQKELAKQKQAGNKITYVTAAGNVKAAKELKDAKDKGTALTDEEKRLQKEKEGTHGSKPGGGGAGAGAGAGDEKSEEEKIAGSIYDASPAAQGGDKEVSPI